MKNIRLKYISIFTILFIGVFYVVLSWVVNHGNFSITEFPYYTFLAKSLLLGKLSVQPVQTNFELSFFNNQYFLYWGPGPVLFVLPYYLIFGNFASDIIYTLSAGILVIVVFFFLLSEFVSYFKLKVTVFDRLFILLNLAFCSPNLFLAVGGKIWASSQIIATLYVLIFYLFYFKFLNNFKYLNFIIAIVFLNLAWFSRITLIVNFISLIYLFLVTFNKKEYFKKLLKTTILISSFFLFVFFLYNQLRFGNILETGLKYVRGNPRYEKVLAQSKYLSIDNVTHNLNHYVLNNVSFSLQDQDSSSPILKFDPEGNSIFSTYPYLLISLLLFNLSYLKNKKIKTFLLFALGIICTNLLILIFYFSTGATQFGSRLAFDFIPLLSLITIIVVPGVPRVFKYMVLTYGFVINIMGVIIFHNLLW
jgi:hypothetical protein